MTIRVDFGKSTSHDILHGQRYRTHYFSELRPKETSFFTVSTSSQRLCKLFLSQIMYRLRILPKYCTTLAYVLTRNFWKLTLSQLFPKYCLSSFIFLRFGNRFGNHQWIDLGIFENRPPDLGLRLESNGLGHRQVHSQVHFPVIILQYVNNIRLTADQLHTSTFEETWLRFNGLRFKDCGLRLGLGTWG